VPLLFVIPLTAPMPAPKLGCGMSEHAGEVTEFIMLVTYPIPGWFPATD